MHGNPVIIDYSITCLGSISTEYEQCLNVTPSIGMPLSMYVNWSGHDLDF